MRGVSSKVIGKHTPNSPNPELPAIMMFFIVLLIVLLVLHLTLLGLALAEGFVLHWVIPSIDLSIAVLIGVVAMLATLHFAVQFIRVAMQAPPWANKESEDPDDEEDDDEEEDDEDDEDEPPESPHPARLDRLRARLRRRRRR